MSEAIVTGLRGIELNVGNLVASKAFYSDIWGLKEVYADTATCLLRARGFEHHALTLTAATRPGLGVIDLAVCDAPTLNQLFVSSQRSEWKPIGSAIQPLPEYDGGGVSFVVQGPEGLHVRLSAERIAHAESYGDRTIPSSLTHVVINSADVGRQMQFFTELLGFRLSDSTTRMEFIRCGTDHHSVAIARGNGLSLNHIAFDMPDIDSLMYGSGRVVQSGTPLQWGVGRHGPGNNVFAYFLDPDGFAVEYTTDMEKVDDQTWVASTAEEWARFPMRPCRWGMAPKASAQLVDAMGGKLQVRHD